jgi:hypothetical protein
MAYDAKIIEIIIASPSDVAEERQIVRDVVMEWNAVHARHRSVALLPVSWETHSSPELGGRPQQMINDRLLAHADLLVGIFWTRVGSPTGKAISGSVEEIEAHHQKGKPVMLYFSEKPAALANLDHDQYFQLQKFRDWARGKGLVGTFEDRDDFRIKFQRELQIILQDNPYLKDILERSAATAQQTVGFPPQVAPISVDARELLTAAASTEEASVFIHRGMDGTTIETGKVTFGTESRRSAARWEGALRELQTRGLVRDVNGKSIIFEITDAEYRLIEGAEGC